MPSCFKRLYDYGYPSPTRSFLAASDQLDCLRPDGLAADGTCRRGGADGGWLEKDRQDRFASGTLWGASVGLNSAGRWYSSQISVGTPLHYPDWLGPDHVSVNWRIAFML
ncbi:hypothetical protein [Enterobacter roggenkampii]|uniref:hypothetical protein n=1 Tax=Enterobacter roggenkampii TaxID=1812935 RepID=UPI003CC92030